jgi:hypothetical protein
MVRKRFLFVFSCSARFNSLYFRHVCLPDASNIIVLSKGNSKAFIASIPIGGHCAPNSTVGDNAL